eukprot:TRINITY_DN1985_c0_g1_i1.p1 TRINITY_DN1985_c0_g1~~TRINITY_DN1985_c0_g1_i1.p1  ORF type:complete len:2168 (-),score=640.96 TRINITY_DN1985_c0_g1_i1:13-6204(-)
MLGDLSQPSVLHNLKLRYYSNLIHTYSGLFLVVINPYQWFPIYTEEVIRKYVKRQRGEVPPHTYSSADEAYRYLLKDHRSQSLLVTGESGAGKTENTKRIIQYLATIGGKPAKKGENKVTLEDQLLQANPLLEALGNAKTTKNNNSSRFGKFIRITFDASGFISGASITSYLLETSRVVHQGPGERSYHIFYQLFTALSEAEKAKYELTRPEDFQFLNKSGCTTIPGMDDKKEFEGMKYALKVLDFTEAETDTLFRIVAGILHLGNIEFRPRDGGSDDDQCEVVDMEAINKAARQFKVDPNNLKGGLIFPHITVGQGERVRKQTSAIQASRARDALAKAIYGRFFLWIVDKINDTLKVKPKDLFIGLLDIAGFEIFKFNSFEQMCINFTNERLQQFFNNHMFKLEQEEYAREGIEWTFVDFGVDSQMTIDLLSKKPRGVLPMLNEQCLVPKASDETFVRAVQEANRVNPRFQKSSLGSTVEFTIKHYAGEVLYNADSWLLKNKDPLPEDLATVFSASKDTLLTHLWKKHQPQEVRGRSGGLTQFVADKYNNQLNDLMDTLQSTYPHFVRCIIPNHAQQTKFIDDQIVLEQLACNGVLEGIRISRMGFPNRVEYKEFVGRYFVLNDLVNKTSPDYRGSTQQIIFKLAQEGVIDKDRVRFGKTKVFFRTGEAAKIEVLREQKLAGMVTIIQSIARAYVDRRMYAAKRAQKEGLKAIQRAIRQYLTMQKEPWMFLYHRVNDFYWRRIIQFEGMQAAQKSIVDNIKKQAAAAQARIQAAVQEIEDLNDKKQELTHEYELTQEAIKNAQARHHEYNTELKTLNSQLKSLEETYAREKSHKKAQEVNVVNVKNDIERTESKIASVKNEIDLVIRSQHKLKEQESVVYGELEEVQGQVRRAQKQLEELTEELITEQDKKREQGEVISKLNIFNQSHASQIQVQTLSKTQLSNDNKVLEKKLKDLKKESIDLESARDEVVQKKLEAEEAGRKLTLESSETEVTLEGERAKANTLKKQNLALTTQHDLLRKALDEQLVIVKKLDKQLVQVRKDLTEAEASKESTEADKKYAAEKNAKLEALFKSLTAQLEEAKATLAKLITAVATLTESNKDAQAKLEALQEQVSSAERTSSRLTTEIASLQSEVTILKENIAKMEKRKSKLEISISQVSDSLIQEKQKSSALRDATTQITSLFSEIKQKITEEESAKAAAQRAAEKLPEQINQLILAKDVSKSNSTFTTQKSVEVQKKHEELKERLEDLTEEKAKLAASIEEATAHKAAVNSDYMDQVEAVKRANEQIRKLTQQLDDLKTNLAQSVAKGNAEEKKLEQATAELKEKKEALEILRKKTIVVEKVGSDLQVKIKQEKNHLSEKSQKLEKFEESVKVQQEKIEALKDKIDVSKQTLKEKEANVHDIETKIANLKEDIAHEQRLRAKLKQDAADLEELLEDETVEQEQAGQYAAIEEREKEIRTQIQETLLLLENQKKQNEKAVVSLKEADAKCEDTRDNIRRINDERELIEREKHNLMQKHQYTLKQLAQIETANQILLKHVESKERKAEKALKISKLRRTESTTAADDDAARLNELRAEIRIAKGELTDYRRQMVHLERQESSLSTDVSHLRAVIRDTKSAAESLKRLGEHAQNEVKQSREEVSAAQEIIEALEEIVRKKDAEIASLREKQVLVREEHDTVYEKQQKLSRELLLVNTELTNERLLLARARKDLSRANARLSVAGDAEAGSSEAEVAGLESKEAIRRQTARILKAVKRLQERYKKAKHEQDVQDRITNKLQADAEALRLTLDNTYSARVIIQKEAETLRKLVQDTEEYGKQMENIKFRLLRQIAEEQRDVSILMDKISMKQDENMRLERIVKENDTTELQKKLDAAISEHGRLKEEVNALDIARKKLRRELLDERQARDEAAFEAHKVSQELEKSQTELLLARSTNSTDFRSLQLLDQNILDTQRSLGEVAIKESNESYTHRLKSQIELLTESIDKRKEKTEAARSLMAETAHQIEELEFDVKTLRYDIAHYQTEARRARTAIDNLNGAIELRQRINDEVEAGWDLSSEDEDSY